MLSFSDLRFNETAPIGKSYAWDRRSTHKSIVWIASNKLKESIRKEKQSLGLRPPYRRSTPGHSNRQTDADAFQ